MSALGEYLRLLIRLRGDLPKAVSHDAPHAWDGIEDGLCPPGEADKIAEKAEQSDIDLAGGGIKFRAENRKGRGEDKTHRLADYTVESLRSIHDDKRDAVFPWPYHRTYVWQVYGRLLKRAGLANGAVKAQSQPLSDYGRSRWE